MKPFFITATGTDIGKTLVTSSLCWQLRRQGKQVTALKPVISGYTPSDPDNDSAHILASCGVTPTAELIETISPWRYSAPLAPSMAAEREGRPIDPEALVQFCRDHESLETDVLLVEGVGGLMVPLTPTWTVLDWMEALQWPVILVGGSYLGSISHTLTALEVLKIRRLSLHCLILCESFSSQVGLGETAGTIEKFLPYSVPLVKIPRITTVGEQWKHTPAISWLCES